MGVEVLIRTGIVRQTRISAITEMRIIQTRSFLSILSVLHPYRVRHVLSGVGRKGVCNQSLLQAASRVAGMRWLDIINPDPDP
jgi:hypothetical protein